MKKHTSVPSRPITRRGRTQPRPAKLPKLPKLRNCTECGRPHTGFTETCGDCLSLLQVETSAFRAITGRLPKEGDPPVTIVTPIIVTTNVTKRGFGSGKGRSRKHKDNAARQKAWRGR